MPPFTLDIANLRAFPFLNSIIDNRKMELPKYVTATEDVSLSLSKVEKAC